ncbi:NAD(P)/FAD-dependent oxidoreductase [Micromonospora sp. R77]|uniref:NAD(P)/FAD-dependent oxidoreductase n=1 Tax=Micromonospora sp. R77 TaxID=2925836 RepID=UPI001F61B5A9|nr:NAD(P)/FAD-dependent oxidoreductase [Micromonospora sp. R77]MCI4061472.1 NAD(P)/FAD-dependent oxidoreductase [Micromonospora sp. R77]
MPSPHDAQTVVIGAGPAGLTAALVLARYRHPVVVVDGRQEPRNNASEGVHGHVGLDGASPDYIRSRAWAELSRYATVQRRRADADNIEAVHGGRFRIGLDIGETIESSSVLLATGVVDVHPNHVSGFSACWGRSVIHCPFCLGEENAGGRWAVVTDDARLAALSAVAFRAWSDDTVAICAESMPDINDARTKARGMGGDIVTGAIRRLHHQGGALQAVEFDDGRVLERDTLVWTLPQRQQPVVTRAIEDLKLTADDAGFVTVDATQCTSVAGLFAAGDVAARWRQSFTAAAAAGATAAEAIHAAAILSAVQH